MRVQPEYLLLFTLSILSLCGKAQEIVVEKLPSPINSIGFDEISPVVSWDGKTIFFTRVSYPDFKKSLVIDGNDLSMSMDSVRYTSQLSQVYSQIAGYEISDPQRSSFNQDVWIAIFQNEALDYLIHPDPPLNNALPNAICSLTPDTKEFVILNQFFEDGGMDQGFSVIRWESPTKWSFPTPLHIDGYYTQSEGVSLDMSADGSVLILSLQRADSYGQNDLYVAFRKADNRFGEPINLGKEINTFLRETTPKLSPDKAVLYFSSNRDGNNDIFFSRRLDSTWQRWSEVRKFRAPVNSEADDSQPFFNANTGYLYFTSKRDGSSDIFRAKIAEPILAETQIKGKVLNSRTMQPEAASVFVKPIDNRERRTFHAETKNGDFAVAVASGLDYRVEANSRGFICNPVTVNASSEYYRSAFDVTILLDPIEEESKISLRPILFRQSTPILLESSLTELRHLLTVMRTYPSLKILIEGHTDNQGPKSELKRLSIARTEMIKNYLTENGISAERIETAGFGGERPVNDNSTEALRAANRRVEIRITRIGTSGTYE